MDNMSLEEEWLSSLMGKKTRENYIRGWKSFKQYLGKNPEEILVLRKEEGKRFITRLVMFFEYLKKQGLSENTARTMIIPLQSFLSYFDVPLRVSNKLPKLHMKLEDHKLSLEEFQKLYKYNDLSTKAWLSLSRDCPARIGDLLQISPEQIMKGEFLIKSEKENVIGKVYISEDTKDLFNKNPEIPRTQRGIDKLLKRACKVSEIPEINQHLLRKFWTTIAINLGIQETIIRILTFKTVPESTLTYFLDREELRSSWKQVIDVLPLEYKANGRISNMQAELTELRTVMKVLAKYVDLYKRTTAFKGRIDIKENEILRNFLESKA
jgi:integrase